MKGTIVISTAKQENFGISVIEAIRYGCIPLLPDRLSYPEIIPKAFHDDFLYQDHNELVEKLCFFISNYPQFQIKCQNLSAAMSRFAWENLIDRYDAVLDDLIRHF